MKRKISIIIAVLLCAVLICTFAACKDKNKFDPSSEKKTAMEQDINAFINNWLEVNAKEEPTNQKGELAKALNAKADEFQFTDAKDNLIKPSFTVDYKDGKYTIAATWTGNDKKKSQVKFNFSKDETVIVYDHWAGKYSKVQESWRTEDIDSSAIVDELLLAGINTVNYVTGNAVTGKFGADGVLGFNVGGKTYGLRVKGNVDGTTKLNNEIGLSIVTSEEKTENGATVWEEIVLGGIYYVPAATAKDSKLYIQYSGTGDDGKLVRDEDGKVVYTYKYIEYADIFGLIQDALPEFKEANDGVISKQIEGLSDLIPGDVGGLVGPIIDLVANAYVNEDTHRYYVDINLAAVMQKASEIFAPLLSNATFLTEMGVDLDNLSGLRGHITLSGKVEDVEDGDETVKRLTDFELAVNIPKSTIYLNGERDNDNEFKVELPFEICFAISLDDFSFLTDTTVEDITPAEAIEKAEYFSPTNFDFSGNVYVNHYELNDQNERAKVLDSVFHFDFVSDINPLEIIENGASSSAKAALVIKQSQGATYNEATASNFLSLSYVQATKTICASGTAFKIPNDDGSQVYTFQYVGFSEMVNTLMLWLGLDTANGNWHGVSKNYELLDYVLTSNTTFQANKTYYVKVNDEYVVAENITVGDPIPENTYYVVPDTYESAKTLLGNAFVRTLISMFLGGGNNNNQAEIDEGEVAAGELDINGIIDSVKSLYNKFVAAGAIEFSTTEDDALSAKIDITAETINEVIDMINTLMKKDIKHIEDPELIKFYLNYGTDYADKCFAKVKYDGNTYEVLFDNSQDNKFIVSFKMTLESGRQYAFSLTADDTTVRKLDVEFNVIAPGATDGADPVVVNHTLVSLSGFDLDWGGENADKVTALLPDTTDALPIFPAENIPNVGTQLAKGIVTILDAALANPQVSGIVFGLLGSFMA
ncbi:MAG TPA: hypothetical protein DCG79_00335 [Clostridiales bacterium]|nr:hypothetical protein [Clostridiales bacterium]